MKTEKEQLLNRKSKGNCGVFVVKSKDRLKKWRLALAQRYSQANVINRNVQIKWEGDVDDPVIKIKLKEGDEATDILLVTIHLYKNNRKLMIQGKYLAEWTATEFAGLSDLADGTSYDEVEWNNEWYQNQDQNKEIENTPDADVSELLHRTTRSQNSVKSQSRSTANFPSLESIQIMVLLKGNKTKIKVIY